MKGKKVTLGTINGKDLLKKTRGAQDIPFRTGAYDSKKSKPRDKNWRKWDY